MDESRYQQFRQLVAGSSAMPPGKQRTFLARQCAEDPETLSRVEELLDILGEDGDARR